VSPIAPRQLKIELLAHGHVPELFEVTPSVRQIWPNSGSSITGKLVSLGCSHQWVDTRSTKKNRQPKIRWRSLSPDIFLKHLSENCAPGTPCSRFDAYGAEWIDLFLKDVLMALHKIDDDIPSSRPRY
jgi:hypothetical protein